ETLTVRYAPTGQGASVTLTPNPGKMVEGSLQQALLAAAQAVGYPSQNVRVELVYPLDPVLRRPIITGDGPSGGGIYAVAIAAALLGDTLRPNICMTGTIQPDLTIGPIGGAEGKLTGCKYAKATDMILPDGQLSMQLNLDARSADVRVHEIHTLAEAYEVATGQPLRRVSP
ncbi:MAG TPA: S16 family serine protease, partial [Nitrospiraceae bacterium]|nr:S16 family serine protease [Nitrospiraceae bacterium]